MMVRQLSGRGLDRKIIIPLERSNRRATSSHNKDICGRYHGGNVDLATMFGRVPVAVRSRARATASGEKRLCSWHRLYLYPRHAVELILLLSLSRQAVMLRSSHLLAGTRRTDPREDDNDPSPLKILALSILIGSFPQPQVAHAKFSAEELRL